MANHYTGDCEMAKEQGEMLLVLMQHCREMKRQETRSRWATGVMFLTFFAAFLWHQVSEHTTKDAPIEPLPDLAGPQAQSSILSKPSVHLLISSKQNENGASLVMKNDSYFIQWTYQNGPHKKYKLTDSNTSLIVPIGGQYFINLRVFYRIPDGRCKGKRLLSLTITVIQYHSNYPSWIKVIEGKETMHCENTWCQSVNLHRVVHLNAKTEIKVQTDSENRDLISMDTYFGVTHL